MPGMFSQLQETALAMQDSDRNLDWLSHDFWNKATITDLVEYVLAVLARAHRLPKIFSRNALVVNISLNQHFIFKLQTSLIG